MKKIVVIGSPGAGKTEFANVLGKTLNIDSIYHLDYFFWRPNWSRTSEEERHTILATLTTKDQWVIEGNFLESIDDQLSQADTVIWLNLSSIICLSRVIRRYISYIRDGIPEIAPGCKDRISLSFLLSIFSYRVSDSETLQKKLKKTNSFSLFILNTPQQVNNFLKKLTAK